MTIQKMCCAIVGKSGFLAFSQLLYIFNDFVSGKVFLRTLTNKEYMVIKLFNGIVNYKLIMTLKQSEILTVRICVVEIILPIPGCILKAAKGLSFSTKTDQKFDHIVSFKIEIVIILVIIREREICGSN